MEQVELYFTLQNISMFIGIGIILIYILISLIIFLKEIIEEKWQKLWEKEEGDK